MPTDDMQLAHRHPYSTRPDLAWLSGALAAVGEKAESSDWSNHTLRTWHRSRRREHL
jgi:hypothetical protein